MRKKFSMGFLGAMGAMDQTFIDLRCVIFFIKFDIKPRMHLLKMSNFSLYHVIVRPTKIMSRHIMGPFLGDKVLEKSKFSKNVILKVDLLV